EVVAPPMPIDFRATGEDFLVAVSAAVADPSIDAVMVIHAPPLATTIAPDREIDAAASDSRKPVVAIMLGRDDGTLFEDSRVPPFAFPEPAAASLGRMYAYRQWLTTEAASALAEVDGLDREAAQRLLDRAAADELTTLGYDASQQLLLSYGVNVPRGAST